MYKPRAAVRHAVSAIALCSAWQAALAQTPPAAEDKPAETDIVKFPDTNQQ
jgi:hypothetical protein